MGCRNSSSLSILSRRDWKFSRNMSDKTQHNSSLSAYVHAYHLIVWWFALVCGSLCSLQSIWFNEWDGAWSWEGSCCLTTDQLKVWFLKSSFYFIIMLFQWVRYIYDPPIYFHKIPFELFWNESVGLAQRNRVNFRWLQQFESRSSWSQHS